MNSNTQLQVLALIVLILLSSFFSAVETAFSSANKIKLKSLANDDNKKAIKTLKLIDNYDKLLSTILIGNNIVNIAATTIATLIFVRIYGDAGATISTIVMTLLVLIFGEITPKSIAKEMPEKFAMSTCNVLSLFMAILTPINFLFSLWKKLVKKVFHLEADDSFSQDELLTIVEEAQKDGDLEEHESNLISSAIEFNDLDVKDVLTPRVDLIALDIKTPLKEMEKVFRMNSFSRIPIYENNIDNIVGVVHEKDFYNLYYSNQGTLKSIIKSTIYTSQHVKISTLLRQLQSSRTHMAVVLDEYGGTAGIITLEDILEELVGDIWDEHDTVKEYYKKIGDNKYLIECEADLDDMFERFNLKDDDDYDFITISGWVIHEFERIPNVGESFDYENLHITVTKTDARKVIEIEVDVNEIVDENEEDEEIVKKNDDKHPKA